jgi:hypothetical protein
MAHRPPRCFQTRLQHWGFGGVQHDRQRRRGRQPAGQRGHVGDAVAADVVDAQIQQMRTVAGLLLGDVEALLVVLGDHRLANALEPLAFVRSPIISTEASWANGVDEYSDATAARR